MAITGELIALFVLLFGALSGLWWKIESKIASEAKKTDAVQVELFNFKLFVAQNYVNASNLRETELRLINAVDKLAVRMEAIVSRLDKIALKQMQETE